MSWIVLAAGLGANFIIVMLLFRRLRADLNRQLRDVRAERNSELILRALQAPPEPIQQQAVQAANGSGGEPEPPPGGPQPVRRKRHLGLFIGGAVAAMVMTLGQTLRGAWQTRRGQLIGTVAGVATVTTASVALLAYEPWQADEVQRPPSSAPTAAPPPGYTQPPSSGPAPTASPSPPGTVPPPSKGTTPTSNGPASVSPPATAPPSPTADWAESTAPPNQSHEQSRPGGQGPPASPEREKAPPNEPPRAESSTGRTPGEKPPGPPAASRPCAGLAVPVLHMRVCLPLGGGG